MSQIISELILKVLHFRFFNFRLAFPLQFQVPLLLLSRVSFRTRAEANTKENRVPFILERNLHLSNPYRILGTLLGALHILSYFNYKRNRFQCICNFRLIQASVIFTHAFTPATVLVICMFGKYARGPRYFCTLSIQRGDGYLSFLE